MVVPERNGIIHNWGKAYHHYVVIDPTHYDNPDILYPPIEAGPFETSGEAIRALQGMRRGELKVRELGYKDPYESPWGEAKVHGTERVPIYPDATPDDLPHN